MARGTTNGAPSERAVRVMFKVAHRLLHLPAPVQRLLSGRRRVKRDGYELDPAIQLLLAIDARISGDWPADAHKMRRERDQSATLFRGPPPHVSAVRDLEVKGANGPLRARHYAPHDANAPLLVYFHGGGFVFGNVDTHDSGCRLLCQHGKFNVLSVEYRLVPEHRFPDAILDAQAALAWAFEHAKELGADPSRVGVGGDSAGGNLSAVVSLLAKEGGPRPFCQLLIYPATDRSRPHPSIKSLSEGFMITEATIEWFHAQYAGAVGADRTDPRLSPLLAKDLGGLPPAIVATAGFDPLRDEGNAYADAMAKAGTKVVRRQYDPLIHGFFNLTGLHDASRDAVVELARLTKEVFAGG
jgi:acetyl esterase